MSDEFTPTAKEPAQAEELARSLEGQGQAELGRDRSQAVLRRIMAEAGPALDRRAAKPAWQRWLLPVGGLGLAGAAAAARLRFWPAVPVTLPAPDAALLKAQAQAAGAKADVRALRKDMQAYRGRMLAVLDQRYGGGR